MIKGLIKTRHILLHPLTLIGALGLMSYLRLLAKSVSTKSRFFTDILFM